jgi:lipopolysaccharide export system protein LptC
MTVGPVPENSKDPRASLDDDASPPEAKSAQAAALTRKPPRLSGRNSYSRLVGLLKVVLPAIAVGLLLLLVIWPQAIPGSASLKDGLQILGLDEVEQLTMVNPRFEGVDEKNQPFSVLANSASQAGKDDTVIQLEAPKADLTLEEGDWLALTAKNGAYDREKGLLLLEGEVTLFHDQGFDLETEEVRIDLDAGRADSDLAVQGQGVMGSIESEGFRVLDRGERIIFTGKSELVLYPEAKKAGEAKDP